jgi:hypothetical protein
MIDEFLKEEELFYLNFNSIGKLEGMNNNK